MTNRGKPGSAGGSAVRYLDLSFEGRQRSKSAVTNNGFRPHGGHRGTKTHPPSMYSFDKPPDYHEQLQGDIERLYANQNLEQPGGSPGWVNQLTNEPTHSEESPLFKQQLLAPNRAEQQFPLQFSKVKLHQHNKKARAASASYYRPNSAHQYLTATDVNEDTAADVDVKLGRPTRTTLLRARQRCNSAPVNAYQMRRELAKRNEERLEQKKNLLNNLSTSMADLLSTQTSDGQSKHSFLVGARYNRANYVDAKSLSDFGVYMPRNSPQGCFLAKPSQSKIFRKSPQNPPVTPETCNSGGSSEESSSLSPPVTPQQPDQAWEESSATRGDGDRRRPQSSQGRQEHVINLNDRLQVKGSGYRGKRPRSSSQVRRPQTAPPTHSRFLTQGLPSVYIQGTGIPKPSTTGHAVGSSSTSRKASSTSLASGTAPPPSPTRSKAPLTVKDLSKRLDLEALYGARRVQSDSAAQTDCDLMVGNAGGPPCLNDMQSIHVNADAAPGDELSTEGEAENMSIGSEQSDDSVDEKLLQDYNLPEATDPLEVSSVSGDVEAGVREEAITATGYGRACRMENSRPDSVASIMKSHSSSEAENLQAKNRKSKVRFADDLTTSASEASVVKHPHDGMFFITENDGIHNEGELSTKETMLSKSNNVQGQQLMNTATKPTVVNPFNRGDYKTSVCAVPDHQEQDHSDHKPAMNPFTDRRQPSSEDSYDTPFVTGVDIKPKASVNNINAANDT